MQHKFVRSGPKPLWLHLNGGAALMAAASETHNMYVASQTILTQAMAGVQNYHNSLVKPFVRDMKIVAEYKGTKIITGKKWSGKNYVLVIPSLINGWQIFDIEKDHSFVAYLQKNNLTPLIIDWATPQHNMSMDDYVASHLLSLVQELLRNGYRIKTMVGYCMGATFIAALHSLDPKLKEKIGKSVLIAPPWDFSYQTMDQQMRIQGMAMQTHAMDDIIPTDFVQSLFWAIDPLQVLKKFRKFPDVKNPDRFVRVEDWLNEGRAVSKSVIQTCLFDWYRDNKVMNGEWRVSESIVDDKALPKNTMIVAGEKDNLVPMQSLKPLTAGRSLITIDTGHIGLMASDKAVDDCWKPIVNYIKSGKVT